MIATSTFPLERATAYSAGFDLHSTEEMVIPSKGSAIVGTGTHIGGMFDKFGLVTMRSGHGFKHDLFSHIGIIDGDYHGEIKVKVFNFGDKPYTIDKGERFAQLTFVNASYHLPIMYDKETFESTYSSEHTGFGSTGK